MHTYLSLLRGINTSGHRKILMKDLGLLYEDLGFVDVKTYIQSGNVIFRTDASDAKEIEQSITNAIEKAYGYDVPSMLRSYKQIQQIMENNPLLDAPNLYVTFLQKEPSQAGINALAACDFGSDRYEIRGREVYLGYEDGYGNSKLHNNTIEKKLGVYGTTRNWRTCNKVMEMLRGAI